MSNKGLQGFFDPRLLGVWTNDNIPASLQHYVRAPLKTHLSEIQHALPSLSLSDRLAIYLHVTTATHEIKHFHDMVGTPFGYAYAFRRQEREMHLIRLLRSLRRVAVPLHSWVDSRDCPGEVREFFTTYSSHELFDLALFYSRSFPGEERAIPGLFLTVQMPAIASYGGDTPSIAVVNYGYDVCRQNGIRHHYYPLTATALLEGAAMNLQHLQIADFFGQEAAHEFDTRYRNELFRSDLWVYAIASNVIASAAARFQLKSNEVLRYKVLDFTFMGRCSDLQIAAQDIPGWRLANFLAYLHYAYPKRQITAEDLLEVLDEFCCEHLKEPSAGTIPNEQLDAINKICVLMGVDSAYTGVQELLDTIPQQAMVRLARLYRTMLRARIDNPECFDDPWDYLCNMDRLPLPPNLSFQTGDRLHSSAEMLSPVDSGTASDLIRLSPSQFWCLYFASTRILEDLVWNGRPNCAFRDWGVQCPALSRGSGIPDHRCSVARCICDNAFRLVTHSDLDLVTP